MWSSRNARVFAEEIGGRGRGAERFHVHPDRGHVLGEGAAGVAAAKPVELAGGQRADREAAPDVGDPVPHALLAAQPDGGDVAGGLRPEIPERGEGDEAGDEARQAVVVTSGGHGIEVRAGQHPGRVPVRARQRAPEVAGEVAPDLEAELPGRLAHQRGRPLVLVAPRRAGHPHRVGRGLPDRLEQAVREGEASVDGGGQGGGAHPAHGANTSRISS